MNYRQRKAAAASTMVKMAFPVQYKTAEDGYGFSGYASVFDNVDLGYDVILPGAFRRKDMKLTKDKKVIVLYQHNSDQPIGKADVEEDEKGLKFDAELIKGVPEAEKAYMLMKANVLDGMSIGFDIMDHEYTEGGVRRIKRAALWEISAVTWGMNPKARIEGVKAMMPAMSKREMEDFLRDVGGLSRSAAKAFLSGGFDAYQRQRDAGEDAGAVVDDLKSFLSNIQKEHL